MVRVAIQTVEGQTCLHFAALWGHTEIARLLIQRGADVLTTNQYGATPLHWCAEYGTNEVGELLLDAGAEVPLPRSLTPQCKWPVGLSVRRAGGTI